MRQTSLGGFGRRKIEIWSKEYIAYRKRRACAICNYSVCELDKDGVVIDCNCWHKTELIALKPTSWQRRELVKRFKNRLAYLSENDIGQEERDEILSIFSAWKIKLKG